MQHLVDECDSEFIVDTQNKDTVIAFLRLHTQWKKTLLPTWKKTLLPTTFKIIWDGIDYPAVESVLNITKVENPSSVFDGIQVMENAALLQLNQG